MLYINRLDIKESVKESRLSDTLSLTHTHTSVPQQSRTPVANPKMPRPLQTVQENGVEESKLKGRLESIKPFSFWRSVFGDMLTKLKKPMGVFKN